MIKKHKKYFEASCLLVMLSLLVVSSLSIVAHAETNNSNQNLISTYSAATAGKASATQDLIDISQGWKVLNYHSDTLPNVEDVFVQGVSTLGDQKCALVQAGNVGDASFTAQRVVPMKKGHQYTIDLIYAQFYGQEGTGYIDFNGDKIVATNDTSDKEYKKTIIPTKDMDYTITASFTTAYPGNAYFKLGYNKNGGGIIERSPKDVTINYIDEQGNKVADSHILSGDMNEPYTTKAIDVKGYVLKEVKGNTSGVFTDQPQIVTYIYKKIPVKGADITVKYLDEDGKEVHSAETISGNIGETYNASTDKYKLAIDSYTLDKTKLPNNAVGTFRTASQTVTYIYKKNMIPKPSINPTSPTKSNHPTKSTDFSRSAQKVSTRANELPQTGDNHLMSSLIMILGTLFIGASTIIIFIQEIK